MAQSRLPLTIIVAATHSNGIGKAAGLPWHIPSELKYFARVTTRLPPSITSSNAPAGLQVQNAVVMGRKTWESIPPKFRPLKGRVNVVLSRDAGSETVKKDGAIWAQSLREAVILLKKLRVGDGTQDISQEPQSLGFSERIARVFIIGGEQIYKAAIEEQEESFVDKVLLTRVEGEWGCDTFFSDSLEEKDGWLRKSNADLSEWVGEGVPEGKTKDKEVEFEFCLYERSP
ncbi:Dihydrofolate reductase [Venturia nashicola]|uniref:Dihydrofolate reductase n=1 Tax=Venturia nashicola TaxID=86259 RepID=A0A4Z1P4J9_9PEZI|nr:Dihydrofolate reductase [Venturia nashicola]